MTPTDPARDRRALALWLLLVAAMIFVMVVLGGVTRLTRSGLSIVEWRLLEGTLPPLDEAHWVELFDQYRLTPEYRKVNVGMDLSGFKEIFWLEYLHRLWGRLIFFVALVPLPWFLWRRRIVRALIPRLVAVPLLVAANGVLGWLMVKSGLVDIPRVSPYRLTAHLGLAVLIYAYIVRVALDLRYPHPPVTDARPDGLRRFGHVVVGLVFLMILSGGFVAGTKAGFAFNTFPLMNGRFFPEGMYALSPGWTNLFENIATVQFNHRLLAYVLCLAVPALWFAATRAGLSPRARYAIHGLLAVLGMQVALGIATLVYVVPVTVAAVHQGGALILFTLALYLVHTLRGRPAVS
jgi:cytochrome c oxidase assembly protein subunit 15